jgi:hypothetical protein
MQLKLNLESFITKEIIDCKCCTNHYQSIAVRDKAMLQNICIWLLAKVSVCYGSKWLYRKEMLL